MVIMMAEREMSAGRHGDAGDSAEDAIDTRLRAMATRLFAELGYDGVTTQMIADAAGVDLNTVVEHYGGKSGLYTTVFDEAVRRWLNQLKSAGEDYTPDADGLIRLVDRYLEYCLDHPELPRLWIYRWMADASDITGLDERLAAPLLRESIAAVRPAVAPDIDPEAAMWTFTWSIHGYMQAGFLDASGRRRPPNDPGTLRRFRLHLHQLARMMAAPDRSLRDPPPPA
jgi:AcrR family transcriptional regulator